MPELPPGLIALLGALLIPLLPGRLRQLYMVALPLLSLGALLQLDVGTSFGFELLGYSLTPVRVDGLSLVFGYAFHLALLLGVIFALHVDDPVQHVAALVYGGAAIGAVFAGDLLTLFLYWEVVAVAPTFLIWARRTPRAWAAGQRHLYWQIASGLLLLAGVLLHLRGGGGLAFDRIGLEDAAGWLILLAFGIKCCFPGLHTWLTDAYPEATPTGTVFLSVFTSKLAVYALARGFAGTEGLIWVGAAMAVFPIFYALIENDLRRVLAYSLINQVGFMVVAIGIGTEAALDGACAQAFAHVMFKALLFMSMGAVLHQTGRIGANELGGLWKSMPFTALCCCVGVASIAAFPLFSAFATKSIILEAVAGQNLVVWLILLAAAAGVFQAELKIPFFAFFARDSGLRPGEAPWNMRLAMGLAALVCVAIGCWPEGLYALLPYPLDYQPYTAPHVVSQLQLLLFSALAFVTLMLAGLYPPELRSLNLDTDWLLRGPLRWGWQEARGVLGRGALAFQALLTETGPRLATAFVMTYGPERGPLKGSLLMGSSILVVLIVLTFYLLVGYELPTAAPR